MFHNRVYFPFMVCIVLVAFSGVQFPARSLAIVPTILHSAKKRGKECIMSDTQTIYIKGALKSSYNATEKDDNGNIKSSSNIISIFKEGATDGEDKDINKFFDAFYKGKNAKWVPEWYKGGKDFIAIKSAYNIPVMTEWDSKQMSFAEWVERGNIRNAKVIVKCNVKESAIYANAMKVIEDGEPYDAFAEF